MNRHHNRDKQGVLAGNKGATGIKDTRQLVRDRSLSTNQHKRGQSAGSAQSGVRHKQTVSIGGTQTKYKESMGGAQSGVRENVQGANTQSEDHWNMQGINIGGSQSGVHSSYRNMHMQGASTQSASIEGTQSEVHRRFPGASIGGTQSGAYRNLQGASIGGTQSGVYRNLHGASIGGTQSGVHRNLQGASIGGTQSGVTVHKQGSSGHIEHRQSAHGGHFEDSQKTFSAFIGTDGGRNYIHQVCSEQIERYR